MTANAEHTVQLSINYHRLRGHPTQNLGCECQGILVSRCATQMAGYLEHNGPQHLNKGPN